MSEPKIQDDTDDILMRACEHIVGLLETQSPCHEQQIILELRTQCLGVDPQNVAQVYFKAMSILVDIGKIEQDEPDLALMSWRLKEEPESETPPPELRVWWFSSPVRKTFRFPVKTFEEGVLVLNALAQYDLHLKELIISNSGGLEERQDNKPGFDPQDYSGDYYDTDGTVWCEWEDEKGNSIQAYLK